MGVCVCVVCVWVCVYVGGCMGGQVGVRVDGWEGVWTGGRVVGGSVNTQVVHWLAGYLNELVAWVHC